jgi:hypothetical protein
MIDLGSMTDKFSEAGQKAVRRAIELSKSRDHNALSLAHLFAALVEVESDLFVEDYAGGRCRRELGHARARRGIGQYPRSGVAQNGHPRTDSRPFQPGVEARARIGVSR